MFTLFYQLLYFSFTLAANGKLFMDFYDALQETLNVHNETYGVDFKVYRKIRAMINHMDSLGYRVNDNKILICKENSVSLLEHYEALMDKVKEAVVKNIIPTRTVFMYAGVFYQKFYGWFPTYGQRQLASPDQLWRIAEVVGLEMPEYDVIKRRMPEWP